MEEILPKIFGITEEEMIEKGYTFDGPTAITFLKEGSRVSRNGITYEIKKDLVNTCDPEVKHSYIAEIDNTGKTICYRNLTTDDLLAEDWILVK